MTQEQWDDLVSFFRATLEREERKQRRACPECLLGHVEGEIVKAELRIKAEVENVNV